MNSFRLNSFDSESQRRVCEKLTSTGVNPYIVNWVISFLSNGQQRVVRDGVYTEFLNINRNLLEKFADDLTLSAPQQVNIPDSSVEEI